MAGMWTFDCVYLGYTHYNPRCCIQWAGIWFDSTGIPKWADAAASIYRFKYRDYIETFENAWQWEWVERIGSLFHIVNYLRVSVIKPYTSAISETVMCIQLFTLALPMLRTPAPERGVYGNVSNQYLWHSRSFWPLCKSALYNMMLSPNS